MHEKKIEQPEDLFDDIIRSIIAPNSDWSIAIHELKEGEVKELRMQLPRSLDDLIKEYKDIFNQLYASSTGKSQLIIKFLAKCAPLMRKEIALMKKDLTMLREIS